MNWDSHEDATKGITWHSQSSHGWWSSDGGDNANLQLLEQQIDRSSVLSLDCIPIQYVLAIIKRQFCYK